MNQKQMGELRERVYENLTNLLPLADDETSLLLDELVFVGRDKEGLVFRTPESQYVVVRTIVKKGDFNGLDSVANYQAKVAAKLEKAKE